MNLKYPFNDPVCLDKAKEYLNKVIENRKFSGEGEFSKKCQAWLELDGNARKVLLTPSCTAALELAALLIDIKPGDEVIMPSFTFPSTANAFALRGAVIVFVDIRPDTMNIDEKLIEEAITEKTKAIVPMHYAGVACEMDAIMDIAHRRGLYVIEDAAQGLLAHYKGRQLGTIGDLGCLSFHETKNYHCGEGGAILFKDDRFIERAEIIREKGTDRSRFLRGQADKYSWVDIGSSYLLSELNSAYLYAQLEIAEQIKADRLSSWNLYLMELVSAFISGRIETQTISADCDFNGHIFYIKTKDGKERAELITFLLSNGVMGLFHYVPLHSSAAGRKYGRFNSEDIFTTVESERLLRLPIYYGLPEEGIKYIAGCVLEFYLGRG